MEAGLTPIRLREYAVLRLRANRKADHSRLSSR